jgi:hypothetical protein
MTEPKRKARAKPSDERRATIEQEGFAAHAARVEHDTRLLARTRKVQLNLRVWPEERDALVEEARAQGYTLNGWATGLIFRAKEQATLLEAKIVLSEAALETKQVLGDIVRMFAPLVDEAATLQISGDYRRAVGKLALLLQPLISADGQVKGREREALVDVLAEIDSCERALETEASDRFRRMRTTGKAR